MSSKKCFALAVAIGFAAFLTGCTGSGDSTSVKNAGSGGTGTKVATPVLAVIPKGTSHEFWKSVHAGALAAGTEFGAEIIWKGPTKEDDRDSQISTVQDFVTKKVDGILLAPLDDTALRMPVKEAQDAGIPVLIFDSGLKDIETVSFVATDNERGGEIAGEHLAKLLGGKGRVVMLRYLVGSASTDARERGFLKAMQANPGITVVSENQYAGASVESAQKAGENLLQPLKKADGSLGIDGIFCPNESATFGMLRVLQDNSWAGKVRLVGFDASEKLVQALETGEIDGLVVQNPFNMGYLGVKNMLAHLKKEPVEKRIDTGANLVTKDNMKDPEIAKLIAPPKK
ncbi:MAG TPA: substrate-binding domain-containing protein [Fimbriimonadaceae bacterium]|nr:substrate-binding domain-containing protein [Fimbriimonadaceae bacterium]